MLHSIIHIYQTPERINSRLHIRKKPPAMRPMNISHTGCFNDLYWYPHKITLSSNGYPWIIFLTLLPLSPLLTVTTCLLSCYSGDIIYMRTVPLKVYVKPPDFFLWLHYLKARTEFVTVTIGRRMPAQKIEVAPKENPRADKTCYTEVKGFYPLCGAKFTERPESNRSSSLKCWPGELAFVPQDPNKVLLTRSSDAPGKFLCDLEVTQLFPCKHKWAFAD